MVFRDDDVSGFCLTRKSPSVTGAPAATHNKTRAERKRRVAEPRGNSSVCDLTNKEDLENKGNKKRNCTRGSKKKVLEETNNSKLRRHVQIRVEDCLHRTSALRSCKKENPLAPLRVAETPSAADQSQEAADKLEEVLPAQEEVHKGVIVDSRTRSDGEVSLEPDDDKRRGSGGCSVVLDERASENEEKCYSGSAVQEEVSEPSVIVEDRTSSGDPVVRQPATISQDDDDGPLSSSSPFSRMEVDSSATALLRFPDDRSDSGVSSLRSGSGDERSGSRSSALSSSDEPPPQQNGSQLPPPLFLPSSSNSHGSEKLTTPTQEPVRVWRDPSLLLVSEPHVRHINSVQHQTLLMSHPAPPAAAPPAPSSGSAPVVSQAQALALAHYPPVVPPPPPLLSPHPLHHHLPPPGLYSQLAPDMLWSKRYAPLPVGTHLLAPAPEDILVERERERVFIRYVTALLFPSGHTGDGRRIGAAKVPRQCPVVSVGRRSKLGARSIWCDLVKNGRGCSTFSQWYSIPRVDRPCTIADCVPKGILRGLGSVSLLYQSHSVTLVDKDIATRVSITQCS